MLCGARKLLTSAGTVILPPSLASRAATSVGNLAFPTPIRGIRCPGAQPGSVTSSSRSSPPYAAPRPSSLTHALPGSAPSTRSLTPCSAVTTSLKARSQLRSSASSAAVSACCDIACSSVMPAVTPAARRGIVGHHGRASRAVDDDDGPPLKQRLPVQRYLDPQVSDEYAGDSHVASPLTPAENSMRPVYEQMFCCQLPGATTAAAGAPPPSSHTLYSHPDQPHHKACPMPPADRITILRPQLGPAPQGAFLLSTSALINVACGQHLQRL